MKSFIKYLFVLVILIPATLATFIPYLFDIYIKLAMLFPSTLYSSILLIDHSDEGNFIFWFLKFYRPVVEAFSFYTLAAHLPDHLSEFIFKFNLIIKFALVIGWITLGYDFYLNHKFSIINFISQTNSIAFKKYGKNVNWNYQIVRVYIYTNLII